MYESEPWSVIKERIEKYIQPRDRPEVKCLHKLLKEELTPNSANVDASSINDIQENLHIVMPRSLTIMCTDYLFQIENWRMVLFCNNESSRATKLSHFFSPNGIIMAEKFEIWEPVKYQILESSTVFKEDSSILTYYPPVPFIPFYKKQYNKQAHEYCTMDMSFWFNKMYYQLTELKFERSSLSSKIFKEYYEKYNEKQVFVRNGFKVGGAMHKVDIGSVYFNQESKVIRFEFDYFEFKRLVDNPPFPEEKKDDLCYTGVVEQIQISASSTLKTIAGNFFL